MSGGLLSDELKQKLGIENESEVVLAGSKKKKKKKDKQDKTKQKQKQQGVKQVSKKEQKKRESADRLKQRSAEADEQTLLFARIAAAQLSGQAALALVSSRSLARRPAHKRELQPSKYQHQDHHDHHHHDDDEDDEDDEDGPIVVIKKRAKVVREIPKPAPTQPRKVAVKTAPAAPEVVKRADPARVARVFLNRPTDLAQQRAELPATQMEDAVMAAVAANDVVVVCGATGSGKTTQVPQWLVEHGYNHVVVTQPRRVAAKMVSERVAKEMGVTYGLEVAYKVRQENNVRDASKCDVLFVTDGLLLAVLSEDVLAEQYGAIVVDEAHERTLGTDVLLGMLSRVLPLRRTRYETGQSEVPPLKLIIMSATLALDQLLGPHLFSPVPPVVSIDGRQFPVETHWLRVTPDDMAETLDQAVRTVSTIHNTLPRGTILVFLPGKREIVAMTRELVQKFGDKEMVIVPLHSGMEPAQQQLAFAEPPDDARMVILATNIAECSLTLPNIRYVVDPGYAREQIWGDDSGGGVFATRRISQASAMQRTGRAGRTMGGHCYRLYSQPMFHHHFQLHDLPQSLRIPPDALVMTLVGMGITFPERFPLPSPPSRDSLQDAQLRLTRLGFLRRERAPLELTVMGAEATQLPVDPPAARLLLALGSPVEPSLGRLAALCCAVWNTGHSLWNQQQSQEKKSVFVAPRAWQAALSAADVFYPICLLQMMRAGGHVAAGVLRRQYGLSATSSEACIGLARQVLSKWKASASDPELGQVEAPSTQQLLVLQEGMLGAFAHNLCRREQSHYIRLLDGQPVYLHPQLCSAAFRDSKHAWISCVDFHTPAESAKKAKRYAVYPFAARPAWLEHVSAASPDMIAPPLVDYSRIDHDKASYDSASDAVLCDCSPRFGPLVAALPVQRVVVRKSDVFAVLLLEGAVFESVFPLAAHLVVPARALLGPLRTAALSDFVVAMRGAVSKATLKIDDQLIAAACRLYLPAVRDAAKKAWTNLTQ